jgi:multicomponent Na+:H+ antiporter subunit B
MYDSIILRTVARLMLPLLVVLSLFLLLRGGGVPGGGFIGGGVAASAVVLLVLAYGPSRVRQVAPFDPFMLAAFGLFFALVWGLTSMGAGKPFLTSLQIAYTIPGIGPVEIETPMLFDVGVFLLMVGTTTHMVLLFSEQRDQAREASLAEEASEQPTPPSSTPPLPETPETKDTP